MKKKNNNDNNDDKALISIKMLLFLETIMAPCANVPPTRISFCPWQRRLSGSFVFTLKTPRSVFGHCVMQSTKFSLKIKQIYSECNKWKIRVPSKSAHPDVLQQAAKLK